MCRLRDFIVYACFFALFSHSLVEGKCQQNLTGRERLILEYHNALRRRHKDTPDLCYGESDSTHTYTSGEWADKLFAKGKLSLSGSKNREVGENIIWQGRGCFERVEQLTAVVDCTDYWYQEIEDWDLANAKEKRRVQTHRFEQLVWKSTKEVRCGSAADRDNFYFVCQYYPDPFPTLYYPENIDEVPLPLRQKKNIIPLKSGVEHDGYADITKEFIMRVLNGEFNNGKEKEKEKENEEEKEKEEREEDKREREKERRDEEKSDEEEKENREEGEEEEENEEKYEEDEDRRKGLDDNKKKNKEYEEHEDRRTGLDENKKKKKKEKEEKDQEDDDAETSTEKYDDYERYDGGRRQSGKGGSAGGSQILSMVVKIVMVCVIMVLLVIIYRTN